MKKCKVCRTSLANYKRPEDASYVKKYGIHPPSIRPICAAAQYIVAAIVDSGR